RSWGADALRAKGIDARVVVEAVDREESETGTRGPLERFHDHTEEIPVCRVQAIKGVQRDQGHMIVATGQQSVVLSERISELERDNMRLRGTLDVVSQRVSRLQRKELRVSREMRQIQLYCRTMTNTRSGATMTREAVNELIVSRVAKVLEARDATRNLEPLVEGVVGLTRWFEKMETVFHISNCPQKYQVKYATCTLLNSALTWWNSRKRAIGVEAAYAMKWTELMKLMTEVYCPRNEIQKMETELWNLTVK
nr:reverse transcriptase domain-containing protein [Tanacetum cinerariifolium]